MKTDVCKVAQRASKRKQTQRRPGRVTLFKRVTRPASLTAQSLMAQSLMAQSLMAQSLVRNSGLCDLWAVRLAPGVRLVDM